MQLEKQLRVTEDSRDQVLEELHKSEDSLLSAEENAAKVSCPYRKHRESNCLSFFLSLSLCLSVLFCLFCTRTCPFARSHCLLHLFLPALPSPPPSARVTAGGRAGGSAKEAEGH